MIRTYQETDSHCRSHEGQEALESASRAAWIDLHNPTDLEEREIERIIGADIPTREEMAGIEASSRVYTDHGAAIMTIPMLTKSKAPFPETADVTFVLTATHLATVRYAEPTAFENFAASLKRAPDICGNHHSAFVGLLDSVVVRIADVLDAAGKDLDDLSRTVFSSHAKAGKRDFKQQIQRLGRNGAIVSKARDTLLGLARVTAFAKELETVRADKSTLSRLKAVTYDAEVLTEHAAYMSGKITFLLDANLGLINSEQNAIIKIFSVVAVVFLPPTTIASIYGMNFEHMPELGWLFGYPIAIAAMVVSIVTTLVFFRRKGWI